LSVREWEEIQEMPRAVSLRFRNFFLILISAACLVLPFHYGEFGFLAFAAFIPYFFVIHEKTPRAAFQSSYLFGFLTFILLGYWLAFVNVLGLFLTVAYLALYFGFFAPPGLPKAIRQTLVKGLEKTVKDPTIQKKVSARGATLQYAPGDVLAKEIAEDYQQIVKIVKARKTGK